MDSDQFSDIATALRDIAEAFVTSHCDYFIGGSFASSMQGEYRATNDIDIVCNLLPKNVTSFLSAVHSTFIVDELALKNAVADGTSSNIIHEPSFIKIDLFLARDEYRNLQLKRAVLVELPKSGFSVRIASPEDIILAKLTWFKKGGEVSDRQWKDILGVIRVQKERLDSAYLKSWAAQLGVAKLLTKAFSQNL